MGPRCCFEGVVGLQPPFREYAKDDLDRHLRGRHAPRGFVTLCREGVMALPSRRYVLGRLGI